MRHIDRHDLIGEASSRPGRSGLGVAFGGELVAGLARDAIVGGEVFSRLDHPGDDAKAPDGLGAFTPPLQPVEHLDIARAGAAAHGRGVIFDVGHALDAARQNHIGRAGLDHHRRRRQGL